MRTLLLWLALLAVSWGDGRDPAAVLKKYGHQLEGQARVQPLEVPSPLGGPAFTHYQSCSQQVGLSLEPYQGKKIELLKCTLQKRSRQGYKLFAWLAYQNDRLVGAWLSTEAPIAPGLGSLDDPSFGSNF